MKAAATRSSKTMKAAITYAHSDAPRLQTFGKHLAILRREGALEVWYDRKILAGDVVDKEISHRIDGCDLFIALVSPDYLHSSYCYDREMQRAMELHAQGRLRIVLVILEPCDWRASPLGKFKALPLDGKPISKWPNENEAFFDAVTELRRVIEIHRGSERAAAAAKEDAPQPTSSRFTARASFDRVQSVRRLNLPTYSSEIDRFMSNSVLKDAWADLDRNSKRLLATVGTKLEPIVQIAPITPTPLVVGFECLALGSLGESFDELTALCSPSDAGTMRICLSIAALETIKELRNNAEPSNIMSACDLKFALNLDPQMLDSPLLRPFLQRYRLTIAHNVLFEINETTSTDYLTLLRNLQVDFELRFVADDVNEWQTDARQQFMRRVEMTKMDYKATKRALDMRGEDPKAAIKAIRLNCVRGKPLVIEGIENEEYLQFLRQNWKADKYGPLFGQGYCLTPGLYWDGEMTSLQSYGLRGGSMLRRKVREPEESFWNDKDTRHAEPPHITLQ